MLATVWTASSHAGSIRELHGRSGVQFTEGALLIIPANDGVPATPERRLNDECGLSVGPPNGGASMQSDTGSTESESATPQTLLDRCLVDGDAAATSSRRRLRRKALGISFVIETAALALLIVVPLFTSIAQPSSSKPIYISDVFGVAHTHGAGLHHATPSTHPPIHPESFIRFTAGQVPQRPKPAAEDSGDNANSVEGWSEGPSGAEALAISGLMPVIPVPPPPSTIRKPEEKRPMKVSEGVEQAQLISRIDPRYPILAVQTRKEGTVVLHAIISRDGSITALDVISGHPLLVKAAVDAVRQWRYLPTLLHGEPVEVETTITVIFRLQQ
jgi:periplasmic protein TonB